MTRRAIIQNGVVINVVKGGEEGIVIPDDSRAGRGWTFDGINFVEPVRGTPLDPVPNAISKLQLSLWLHRNGFPGGLENTIVAAIINGADPEIKIFVDTATLMVRNDPNLVSLANQLAIQSRTVIDLDTAFRQAERI